MEPDPLGQSVSINVMNVSIINSKNNWPLTDTYKELVNPFSNIFLLIKGVACISELENYTENFGVLDDTRHVRSIFSRTLTSSAHSRCCENI